jgi:hypothetical protein
MWNICCASLPAVAAIAFYYIGFAIVCAIVAYLFLSRITVLDLVNRVKSKLFYNITLIKKKTKLSSYLRKFRRDRVQSHILYTRTYCVRGVLGLRQINTWRKVPSQVNCFRWRHFALPSMSLIFLRLAHSQSVIYLCLHVLCLKA